MGYYVDLNAIGLMEYTEHIKKIPLLPNHEFLKHEIEPMMSICMEYGIETLEQLRLTLSTMRKSEVFALKTQLPLDAVIALRQEINGLKPKPRNLSFFCDITTEICDMLKSLNITTTYELYFWICSASKREVLNKKLNIERDVVFKLASIVDVSRLRFVNPPLATLLIRSGYFSIDAIRVAESKEIYERVIQENRKSKLYKDRINVADLGFLVDSIPSCLDSVFCS